MRPLRNALIVLMVTVVVTVSAIAIKESEVHNYYADRLLKQKGVFTRYEFDRYFAAIDDLLNIVRQWGERRILNLEDRNAMNNLMVPILDAVTQVSAFRIVDNAGGNFQLVRTEEGWVNDFAADSSTLFQQNNWIDESMQKRAAGTLQWSNPYQAGNIDRGVTATIRWRDEDSTPSKRFAAVHINALQLKRLAAQTPITDQGMLLVFSPNKSLVWLSSRSGLIAKDSPAYEFANQAIKQWLQLQPEERSILRIPTPNGEWRGAFYPLTRHQGTLELAVLIPLAALGVDLLNVSDSMVFVLLALSLLAIIWVAWHAYVYRRSMNLLAQHERHQVASVDAMNALIKQGEGRELEFKSTLRWNLKSNRAGKEIELAWLKSIVAYLNGEGGVVLIGVADDGSLLGLQADGFQNEDKLMLHFNNLINQHIGLEYSRFVHAHILVSGDHPVLVIECQPARVPVYLKNGEEETFFIRVGPSSRKLAPSKVIDYLKEKNAVVS